LFGNYKGSGKILLELLVVIIIIGILSSVAFPIFHRVIDNAKLNSHLTNIKTVQKTLALEHPVFNNSWSFMRWLYDRYPDMICPWDGNPYRVYNGAIGYMEEKYKCYIGFLKRRNYYLITAYHYNVAQRLVITAVQRYGGCDKEYVVIKNISTSTITLGGWYISDGYGRYSYKFVFDSIELFPNDKIKIYSNLNVWGTWYRDGRIGRCFGGINNNYSGQCDVLFLVDPYGRIEDFSDEQNPVDGPLVY